MTNYEMPHTNVIIRKKIKSNAKLGTLLIEVYDEIIAGVYPICNHTDRLKKHNIHPYTWDRDFGKITKKVNGKIEIDLIKYMSIFPTALEIVKYYSSQDKIGKKMLQDIILSEIKKI